MNGYMANSRDTRPIPGAQIGGQSPLRLGEHSDGSVTVFNTGKEAYEDDVRKRPNYENGQRRPKWEDLRETAQYSWNRNPTARAI